MMRRMGYSRWDLEDDEETDLNEDEFQFGLDGGEEMMLGNESSINTGNSTTGTSTSMTTTFVQPNNTRAHGTRSLFNSLTHHHHHHLSFLHQHASNQQHVTASSNLTTPTSSKSFPKKISVFGGILGIFLVGFFLGTLSNISNKSATSSSSSSSSSSKPTSSPPLPLQSSQMTARLDTHSHQQMTNPPSSSLLVATGIENGNNLNNNNNNNININNNNVFPKLLSLITAENIKHNLRRMSQEAHTTGTAEGRSMAGAIRDLWRSNGLSVRLEQHKTTITKTDKFNYVEVYDRNGSSVTWRSLTGFENDEDSGGTNSKHSGPPLIAFSPPTNLNGTLIYGHYGTLHDFLLLEREGLPLSGSFLLVRFGSTHISQIVSTALSYGIVGLIFYPDPADFGPNLPGNAVRRDSLLSLTQLHERQKHGDKGLLPAHTINWNDAKILLRYLRSENPRESPWSGSLFHENYPFGGGGGSRFGLRIYNEAKTTTIYNVVAAIPGAWESDRYIIVGCAHDSWRTGAGDPGIGLAVMTELTQSFATMTIQYAWRPRRSILFISWDAHLYGFAGVFHWLQEHHFEIWSRAVAYIDLGQLLQGNQTLHVVSSPLLREVAAKAIQRVQELESLPQVNSKGPTGNTSPGIHFSSTLTGNEPSFLFLGNLGIPFIRFTVTNGPKEWDYPLFQTGFDTFDNFSNLVDPTFTGAQTLGRIISGLILLLVDSSLLPMNVEDYVEEIQRGFGSFMAVYQEDFHRANLSIAYLQAAVMRLEVIGDNFRTDIHNRSVINLEHEPIIPESSLRHSINPKKLLFHRIINDKLMEIERAFLSRKSDTYKHQVIGFSSCSSLLPRTGSTTDNCGFQETDNNGKLSSFFHFSFPRLRQALNCRRHRSHQEQCPSQTELLQEVGALTRSFDAAAATLQSPLLPEESDSSST